MLCALSHLLPAPEPFQKKKGGNHDLKTNLKLKSNSNYSKLINKNDYENKNQNSYGSHFCIPMFSEPKCDNRQRQ